VYTKAHQLRNKLVSYGDESLVPRPTPKLEDHPLVGAPRLFTEYIRRYPPYLGTVSSIHNSRTRHGVVTGSHTKYKKIW